MRSLVVLTALAAFVALAPVPADAQSFTVTGASPETPMLLFWAAPMMPATCVP